MPGHRARRRRMPSRVGDRHLWNLPMATPALAPRTSARELTGRHAPPRPAPTTSTGLHRGRQPRSGFVLYVALGHPGAASTSPTELLKSAEALGDRAREWLPQARTYGVVSTSEPAPGTGREQSATQTIPCSLRIAPPGNHRSCLGHCLWPFLLPAINRHFLLQ